MLFDELKVFTEIMSLLSLQMIIYGVYLRYRTNARTKLKEATYKFCLDDSRRYELIFQFNDKTNEETAMLFSSEQAEALQHFEKIAIGVKNKLLDETVIFDYYIRYFIMAHESLKYPLLKYSTDYGDPMVYINFIKLLNKWRNEGLGYSHV